MPNFSRNLEQSLKDALSLAKERQHEYATLEHLLLALTEDSDASALMRACLVDPGKLRESLISYLESEHKNLVADSDQEPNPTSAFQRALQRATIDVQTSGREEVTGANVLVSILREKESHAAYFLQQQDMTRYDAMNFISHGIAKHPDILEQKSAGDAEDKIDAKSNVQTAGWMEPTLRQHEEKIAALERVIRRQAVEIELLREAIKNVAPPDKEGG